MFKQVRVCSKVCVCVCVSRGVYVCVSRCVCVCVCSSPNEGSTCMQLLTHDNHASGLGGEHGADSLENYISNLGSFLN